jgi:hypothetical protein
MKLISSAAQLGILCLVAAPVEARADEVLSVKFPHGPRKECSTPVVGRFSASGPGRVLIRETIIPYMSLGWHPNLPISYRSSFWAIDFWGAPGKPADFTRSNPLPGLVSHTYIQGGKPASSFVDGVTLVLDRTYELDEPLTYTVDVMGSPQCWPTADPENPYWQEGQELRVEVEGGLITDVETDQTGPEDEGDNDKASEDDQALDLNGGWQTDFGAVILWQDGSSIRGRYDEDEAGQIEGTLAGSVVTGFWGESMSDEECRTERLGTRYWGRIRWIFDDGTFTGVYGYCDDEPVWPWNGRRP